MADGKSFGPADIVSIQIRPCVFVRIAGIPHDLSEAEAKKIADVVKAYACVDVPKASSDG